MSSHGEKPSLIPITASQTPGTVTGNGTGPMFRLAGGSRQPTLEELFEMLPPAKMMEIGPPMGDFQLSESQYSRVWISGENYLFKADGNFQRPRGTHHHRVVWKAWILCRGVAARCKRATFQEWNGLFI